MTAYLDDLHIRLLSLPSSRPFYFCLLPSVPSPPSVSVSFFFSTTVSLRSSPSFRPSVSHSFSTSTSLRLPLLHLSLLPSIPSVILSFPLPLFLHLYLPPFLPFLPSFRLPLLTSLSPIPYSLPPSTYVPSLSPSLPPVLASVLHPPPRLGTPASLFFAFDSSSTRSLIMLDVGGLSRSPSLFRRSDWGRGSCPVRGRFVLLALPSL